MRSRPALSIAVESLEDALLIRVAGEIDRSTVAELRSALGSARREGTTALLDLAGVKFMDSSGVKLLVETSHASAETDWTCYIVRTSAAVRRVIELTRTTHLVGLVEPAPLRQPPHLPAAQRSRAGVTTRAAPPVSPS